MIKLLDKYQAILFDMDGVIINSMPYHALAWQKAFDSAGIKVDEIEIYKREGMPGPKSIKEIYNVLGYKIPSESEIVQLKSNKNKFFHEHDLDITFFPEIPELLSKLEDMKIVMGLVTGSNRKSMQMVLKNNIADYFKIIICGDDVKHGKPDPEPYLKGLEALDFNADKVLVIENAPMGIESAKNAGLKCFAIETSLPEEYLERSDKVFKNHKELMMGLGI